MILRAIKARWGERSQNIRAWQRRDLVVGVWSEPQATEAAVEALATHIQKGRDAL